MALQTRAGLVILAITLAADGRAEDPRTLTFEDRVRATETVQRVAYGHQLGATEAFESAIPRDALEAKVRGHALNEALLERHWGVRIGGEEIAREAERMFRGTRLPARLLEIWNALGRDGFVFQECVARPTLAARLLEDFYGRDERIHASARATGDDVRRRLRRGVRDVSVPGATRETLVFLRGAEDPRFPAAGTIVLSPGEWTGLSEGFRASGDLSPVEETDAEFAVRVVTDRRADRLRVDRFTIPKKSLAAWLREQKQDGVGAIEPVAYRTVAMPPSVLLADASSQAPCDPDDSWHRDGIPEPRRYHTAVWTGTFMLVWGGRPAFGYTSFADGGRYDPALDSWDPITNVGAPAPRTHHTAIWTGTTMIVWGGGASLDTGGIYDPIQDSWIALPTTNAPSARNGHTAIWTGTEMIVWGAPSAGGRYRPSTNTWVATSEIGAPSARDGHTAVWTGDRMIVWGGVGTAYTNTGGRYNPSDDTWEATATTDAPSARSRHTAVWTGTAMIVWGGQGGGVSGALYEPVSDKWTPTPTTGAPVARYAHVAVWTGTRMIVWGGTTGSYDSFMDTGGILEPTTNMWLATPIGAPGRRGATGVWTGTEMIVWGGENYFPGVSNTGYRYEPVSSQWRPVGPLGLPGPRRGHAAVWSGSEMIVWGGTGSPNGARYDPALDTWTALPVDNAPNGYYRHLGVWAGNSMLVWGGGAGGDLFNTGRRYDPLRNVWVSMTTNGAPAARQAPKGVWANDRFLVWGGYAQSGFPEGGRYDPVTDSWLPISTTGAPTGRSGHAAAWTGTKMIVWGGYDGGGYNRNDGGRYDPVTDTWESTSLVDAPQGRTNHTAVWTGSHMLVWGGNDSSPLGSGGRYDPVSDAWLATATTDAPSPRYGHTAIWTGRRMVVWGGETGFQSWLMTGGVYSPESDAWTATSTDNAPLGRTEFTSVWTGTHMIVWGGYLLVDTNTGSSFALDHDLDGDGDGWTECSGDCNDSLATVFPGAVEICDGRDNNCDGVLDEGFIVPGYVSGLLFDVDESLSWQQVVGADHFDVLAGDLAVLRSGGGNFRSSVLRCVANDGTDTTASDSLPVSPGTGRYYLVRAGAFCKAGPYGTGAPREMPNRDIQINESVAACP